MNPPPRLWPTQPDLSVPAGTCDHVHAMCGWETPDHNARPYQPKKDRKR